VKTRSIDAQPGTQAVARAIRVLLAFSDERPTWGLKPLSDHLGLNKTTVHRLLSVLEREELIRRLPGSEQYRLGPEAIALGGRALRATGLREAARPALEELARATRETVTLEVLIGSDVLIVDEVTSSRLLSGAGELGVRYPAHATATGKVLLAGLGSDGAEAAGDLRQLTPRTITDRARLGKVLRQVERDGYARNVEELERGFDAVGAPVRDGTGDVVAAVGVGGPSIRMRDGDARALVGAVCAAGAAISRRLGHRSEG
jgi:DNA-binding IclR family transcriptional regulator